MKIGTTAVILSRVADKIDHEAIEARLGKIKVPEAIEQDFDELCVGIIVRGDDFYPEEHYRTENKLLIALQFNPETVLSMPTEAVTQMICNKAENYLHQITDIEEREYTMMME